MYADIEYISSTGKIPILPRTPFLFNDDLVLKTEKELQQMEFSSLLLYNSTLSTSISYQKSTMKQNSKIQGLYSYLKKSSQSTIDGLNREININSANIAIYEDIARNEDQLNMVWEYDGLEWVEETLQYAGGQRGGQRGERVYVSTLHQFDSIISHQTDYISKLDSTLLLYKTQYESSLSSIKYEYSTFDSKAKIYSTAVWRYKGYEDLYEEKKRDLNTLNVELSTAKVTQQKTSAVLDQKIQAWQTISGRLNTLYSQRGIIGSNITRNRREESDAYINYMSSINGLSTASSVYTAAIINQQYAIAISDLTNKIRVHSDSLNQYNDAELQWQANTGNTALRAARDMAKQQLDQKERLKISAQNASSNLFDLATLANTKAYETLLSGYDNRIDVLKRTSRTFNESKKFSLDEVKRFSSIYEQATIDIAKYAKDIKRYSTLYESSINGASTFLGLYDIDFQILQGETNEYNAVSRRIQGLTIERDRLSSDYSRYMSTYELHRSQYRSSISSVETYKLLYDTTNSVVIDLQKKLYAPGGLMSMYYATLFMNSSMLNDDIMSQKVYDSEIMNLVNQQDTAIHEYRETVVRSKRIQYQQLYETEIYTAVEFAQSNQIAIANLETNEIHASRESLTNINTFLTLFSNIYTMFNTQQLNITRISTSVGYESNAWSTLNSYTWKQYFNITPVNQATINASVAYLTMNQDSTGALLQTFAVQQSNIDSKKLSILDGLKSFYADSEILAQNDTISSFILASENDVLNIIHANTGPSELTWTNQ
jgi:hypothetical protein